MRDLLRMHEVVVLVLCLTSVCSHVAQGRGISLSIIPVLDCVHSLHWGEILGRAKIRYSAKLATVRHFHSKYCSRASVAGRFPDFSCCFNMSPHADKNVHEKMARSLCILVSECLAVC